MSKDDFEEMLNDTYPAYVQFGQSFQAGRIVRLLDPALFTTMYFDFIHAIEADQLDD